MASCTCITIVFFFQVKIYLCSARKSKRPECVAIIAQLIKSPGQSGKIKGGVTGEIFRGKFVIKLHAKEKRRSKARGSTGEG